MQTSALQSYLAETKPAEIDGSFVAYIAALDQVASVAPLVAKNIVQELADQRSNIKLIASENYSSLATQLAAGNLLTDKYAEGFPGNRFYAGCENVDRIESFAAEQACKLFNVPYAYVQPHSGADANLIAFWAILSARVEAPALAKIGATGLRTLSDEQWQAIRHESGNQRLLALDYYSGGHLTHGYRMNVSARMFDAHGYSVREDNWLLDYDAIERQARELKPLVLLAGYSAYPRKIDFARMRKIADVVGAVFMVDMAHFAGLVAGGVFEGEYNPIPHAHIITTTTHKTLRGPRGGLVLANDKAIAEQVNKGCPLVIGGPLPHIMAAKAVAFTEALRPEFKTYAANIVRNAQALAAACVKEGLTVATGGTDNHLMLIDCRPLGVTGLQADAAVRSCGLTLNRNSLPHDKISPLITNGLRIGTPAVTTLGMGPAEMAEIAAILKLIVSNTKPKAAGDKREFTIAPDAAAQAKQRVAALLSRYPVYPQLNLAFLQKHFGEGRA